MKIEQLKNLSLGQLYNFTIDESGKSVQKNCYYIGYQSIGKNINVTLQTVNGFLFTISSVRILNYQLILVKNEEKEVVTQETKLDISDPDKDKMKLKENSMKDLETEIKTSMKRKRGRPSSNK